MSELLTIATSEAEQKRAKQQQRGSNSYVYDVDGFRLVDIGDTFPSDYDLFYTFLLEYNGKKIEDYLKTKKGRKGVNPYDTARFPEADKNNMMDELKLMFDINTEKVNAKITQYRIVGIKQDVIDRKIEKMKHMMSKAV